MDIVSNNNNRRSTLYQRRIIYILSHGRCHYCKTAIYLETFHADHVVPWFRSRDTSLRNLVASCWLCNKSKHTMSYERFIYKLTTEGLGWRWRRLYALKNSNSR